MLELRDVVKHYGGAGSLVRAVDGVSLTLAPGRLSALYGPSGSGKTTLLLLAAGVLAPEQGSVSFEGTDLATLSPREADQLRLRRIGVIFQSSI